MCEVCLHNKRLDIDRELVRGTAVAKVAKKYSVSYDVLYKHKREHLTRQMEKVWQIKGEETALSVFQELENMIVGIKTIVDKASAKNQDGKYLAATKELRNSLELLSKIQFAVRAQNQKEEEFTTVQTEITESMTSAVEENIENLHPLEKDIYASLLMKLMNNTQDRIPGIKYPDGATIQRHDFSNFVGKADTNPTGEAKEDSSSDFTRTRPSEAAASTVKPVEHTHIEYTKRGRRR